MLAVIELVLPLFGLIFLGYISGKIARIPFQGLAWMNFFIIYVALPALFYKLLSNTPVQQFSNIGFIAVSISATFIIFCLVFLLARLRKGGDTSTATIQGLAAAYGNIGYLGPPLAVAAFGPAAGVPIALIFCFENAMHFALAPLLMAFANKRQQQTGKLVKGILYNIFSHPFILATIAGVLAAVFAFKPPASLQSLLDFLAGAAGPCALFAMGVTAALRPLKRIPFELTYIVPVKLFVHPLLAYLLLIWLVPELDPLWLYSAVLLASLPTATNFFVIAQQYGVWQERASSAVVITTLFAMISVTTFLFMVQSGWMAR